MNNMFDHFKSNGVELISMICVCSCRQLCFALPLANPAITVLKERRFRGSVVPNCQFTFDWICFWYVCCCLQQRQIRVDGDQIMRKWATAYEINIVCYSCSDSWMVSLISHLLASQEHEKYRRKKMSHNFLKYCLHVLFIRARDTCALVEAPCIFVQAHYIQMDWLDFFRNRIHRLHWQHWKSLLSIANIENHTKNCCATWVFLWNCFAE